MSNNPWLKLAAVSVTGIVLAIGILWGINEFSRYNGYQQGPYGAYHAGTNYGMNMNDMYMNGMNMNGMYMNGMNMNDMYMNGMKMHGMNMGGMGMNMGGMGMMNGMGMGRM